jgi:hypothetical protein
MRHIIVSFLQNMKGAEDDLVVLMSPGNSGIEKSGLVADTSQLHASTLPPKDPGSRQILVPME